MPYQVSWQSVSMKSQRPVHVLRAALAADTPQQAPAAARIVAAKIPSFVMTAPLPQHGASRPKKSQLQDRVGMTRKFSIRVAAAPQWSRNGIEISEATGQIPLRLAVLA